MLLMGGWALAAVAALAQPQPVLAIRLSGEKAYVEAIDRDFTVSRGRECEPDIAYLRRAPGGRVLATQPSRAVLSELDLGTLRFSPIAKLVGGETQVCVPFSGKRNRLIAAVHTMTGILLKGKYYPLPLLEFIDVDRGLHLGKLELDKGVWIEDRGTSVGEDLFFLGITLLRDAMEIPKLYMVHGPTRQVRQTHVFRTGFAAPQAFLVLGDKIWISAIGDRPGHQTKDTKLLKRILVFDRKTFRPIRAINIGSVIRQMVYDSTSDLVALHAEANFEGDVSSYEVHFVDRKTGAVRPYKSILPGSPRMLSAINGHLYISHPGNHRTRGPGLLKISFSTGKIIKEIAGDYTCILE